MAEMVALVAVEAALASAERRRRSSLPLPLHASDSGATMYLVASSAVRGGRPELGAEEADMGAAVEAAVGAAVCVCERVCRVVAWRLGGNEEPCAVNTGLRREGESKE
eukprot:4379130-Pleurochrysis_carterae.AAC.1